ncbi:MAG: hypothetical protein U1E45_24730 [Geminicoccaceae bacterium]
MRKFLPAGAAAMVLWATGTVPSEANDRSVQGVAIPASACQLADDSTATLNATVGWIVRNGVTAKVLCPVPINHIELGGTTNDNDMSKFRIHFTDSDGVGTGSIVKVFLLRHTSVPLGTTEVCRKELAPATTSTTSTIVPCVHDIMSGGMFYEFAVVLHAAPGGYAFFLGLDFP